MTKQKQLLADERIFYRDQLRAARYAALADSEGFQEICYALEALGLRLHGKKENLGVYKQSLKQLSNDSEVMVALTDSFPSTFTGFDALFELVKTARNDAMHTGVYARHATVAAMELCIGLEAAIMKDRTLFRHQVKHYMVKSPVSVEPWQPVAHARQLMLAHSFSYLPVKLGKWKLVSEAAMARYLQFGVRDGGTLKNLLAATIQEAALGEGLVLLEAQTVRLDEEVHTLLQRPSETENNEPRLWLVEDAPDHLCGVLSPFELM